MLVGQGNGEVFRCFGCLRRDLSVREIGSDRWRTAAGSEVKEMKRIISSAGGTTVIDSCFLDSLACCPGDVVLPGREQNYRLSIGKAANRTHDLLNCFG
jgi:hypothetical protein